MKIKKCLQPIFIIGFIVLIVSCKQGAKKEATAAEGVDSGKDSLPGKAVIKYAHSFTIDYYDHYKLVRVLNTLTGKSDTLQYLLVQRGTPVPSGYPKAQVIPIPVKTIIGMASMHVALADFAEVSDRIIALGTLQYVTSPEVRKNIKTGKRPTQALDAQSPQHLT